MVRVAERIAHEVAERRVHEAIAALSVTSEQTARSVAQTVAASATQDALDSWRVELAKTNERAEHLAVPAAEQAVQAIMQRVVTEAEAARQVAEKAADEKLREALVTVQSTAERVARETLDSAKAAIEDASRQILDSARADLQESSRIAAEAAARPVAESAARAAIEQVARETLAAAREEEAASRSRVEQTTIAVAERVGRELVQLAFSAAVAKRQGAAGERIHAMESLQAHGEEPLDEQVNAADAEAAESTVETRENSDTEPTGTTPAPGYRRGAIPTAWTVPRALLPWLTALTLAVLYLLVKSFL
jgi:hypothetical protein